MIILNFLQWLQAEPVIAEIFCPIALAPCQVTMFLEVQYLNVVGFVWLFLLNVTKFKLQSHFLNTSVQLNSLADIY